MMKKRWMGLILAGLMIVSLCACGTAVPPADEDEAETVTVTDHNGQTVVLPRNIERIAVCDVFPLPSVLSVFFGSADRIVAMSTASMAAAKNGLLSELFPEILEADTSAINGSEVNIEQLLLSDPQIVFYSASNPALGEMLTNAGLAAVAISADQWEYDAVETLNQWIKLLSEIFPEDATDRAEKVKVYSEDAVALVKERTSSLTEAEKKRIFFLFQYSEDTILTSGKSFFGQWWADTIGAVNAAEELTADKSVKVSLEQVYAWDPEIVLITNFTEAFPEDLYENKIGSYDWSGIRAVKEKKVSKMPLGMYRSYTAGVDTPVTLFWLAKTVYPELFTDVDITKKTVEYYQDVFGITLTEEQANKIFTPVGDAGKVNLETE